MRKAPCPSLGDCLCVIFSTCGAFSACRSPSETAKRCTIHSGFFSCPSVVPYKWEKEPCLEGSSAGIAHSAAAERGAFCSLRGALTHPSSSPLLPVIFDRAFINPTPLLTFSEPITCAQTHEFSVITSLTASGCVFQVCSPGLY